MSSLPSGLTAVSFFAPCSEIIYVPEDVTDRLEVIAWIKNQVVNDGGFSAIGELSSPLSRLEISSSPSFILVCLRSQPSGSLTSSNFFPSTRPSLLLASLQSLPKELFVVSVGLELFVLSLCRPPLLLSSSPLVAHAFCSNHSAGLRQNSPRLL